MIHIRSSHFILILLAAVVLPLQALSDEEARHLLERTGFGTESVLFSVIQPLSRVQAVLYILDTVPPYPSTELPDWYSKGPLIPPRGDGAIRQQQRKAFMEKIRTRQKDALSWRYEEMMKSPSPMAERLTLFWQNHFATEFRKVKSPWLMLHQEMLIRSLLTGDFKELVAGTSRDPAMIIYLDNQRNTKRNPNENYARELMELHTLGEGYYSETDVREIARAFTGWRVDPQNGEFIIAANRHDENDKLIFGRHGNFNGDDVINLIFNREEMGMYIVEKLWIEFISPEPDSAETESLARLFRNRDWEIRPLLEELLLSDSFWDPVNRSTLVKSPMVFLFGMIRTWNLDPSPEEIQKLGRSLGQELYNPPGVEGWPVGNRWITSSTVTARADLQQKIAEILRKRGINPSELDDLAYNLM